MKVAPVEPPISIQQSSFTNTNTNNRTPIPIPIPVQQQHPATAALTQQNSQYLAYRAALEFSSDLATADAQRFSSNTVSNAENHPTTEQQLTIPIAQVSLVPTLSPRLDTHDTTNNYYHQHTTSTPPPPGNQNNVPHVIYMERTVAVAAVYPLTRDELLDAQSAEWKAPSRNFETLTERLMAFYATHDVKKANYRYIGNVLRLKFGTIHIGEQPDAWVEQNLIRQLHDRYLNLDVCSHYCAPPGCGGAYDTNALGWLKWWSIILFLPTLVLLSVGYISLSSHQQYTLRASVPTTIQTMQRLNASRVDGTTYNNWKGVVNSVSFVTVVAESSASSAASSAATIDQSLNYIPSFRTATIGHGGQENTATRVHWQVLDANDAVVHTMSPTTLVPGRTPHASKCTFDGNTCTSTNGDTSIDLALYKSSTDNKAVGCMLANDDVCQTTTTVVSQQGEIEFANNAISLKGVKLPLQLHIFGIEFRSNAPTVAASSHLSNVLPSHFPASIEIQYNATQPSNALGHFLIVVGCLFLFVGCFFLFVAVTFLCCGGDIISYKDKVYDEKGALKGHKTRTRLASRSRARSANSSDDLVVQLYCMFYCCAFLPDLLLCTSQLCDVMCSSMGAVCSSLKSCCDTITGPCICRNNRPLNIEQTEGTICCEQISTDCSCGWLQNAAGECVGACFELGEACCCDCNDCDCDCGSMDCAC